MGYEAECEGYGPGQNRRWLTSQGPRMSRSEGQERKVSASGAPATQASPGANAHPGTTPAGSANVAIVTADEGDGFWMAIEEAAHAQPVHAELGLRWGHPETLHVDVHAQVMGIDLDPLSGYPEEPESSTHAETIGAEPDPLVGQPDDPKEGEDAQLAGAESEDLLGAWEDWLVEVEEVEVEAADENAKDRARSKPGAGSTGPRNATEPRPPSQKPTRTRDAEGGF